MFVNFDACSEFSKIATFGQILDFVNIFAKFQIRLKFWKKKFISIKFFGILDFGRNFQVTSTVIEIDWKF